MTTEQAVLWAFRKLLELHETDLQAAGQVNAGFLPRFGHGDDIWLRTEHVHVIAEVTLSGEGCTWSQVVGGKEKKINDKLKKLRGRVGATHRYFFVPECIAQSVQNKISPDDVKVVGIATASPVVAPAGLKT